MHNRHRDQNDPRWLLVALILLLFVGGGVAVLVTTQGGTPGTTIAAPLPQDPPPQRRATPEPTPAPRPQVTPEPEPQATPEPEADPDPAHVDVPELSPFGRLLMICDTILAMRGPPRAGSAEAWVAYSVLHQLDSNHQHHALALYRGKATGAEHSAFRAAVERACFRPDLYTEAFRNLEARALVMRLYGDAELPVEDPASSVTLEEIARFRPRERVTPALANEWLVAIESEFGPTGYGETVPKLDILLFGDERDYQTFSRLRLGLDVPTWSQGYFSPRMQLIGAIASAQHNLAETIRHELFHALQSRLAPRSLRAPWFSEGTATWLSKAPSDGRQLRTSSRFREVAWGYLRMQFEGGLQFDLEAFLRMEPGEFYANPHWHYLLAYCWVDFVRGEHELYRLYREYWSLLRQGVDHLEALERTFLRLDLAHWQGRFIQHAYTFAPLPYRPRFIPEAVPTGSPRETGGPLTELDQWESAVERLWYEGFDTRPGPLTQNRDLPSLVIMLDDTVSMDETLDVPDFDFEAFARRQFALRFVHEISFGEADDIPMQVRLPIIEAALTGRTAEYTEATGIGLDDQLVRTIERVYADRFAFKADALTELTRHELAVVAAESIALFVLDPNERRTGTILHFNVRYDERRTTVRARRDVMSGNFLTGEALGNRLGNKRLLTDGSDCDWWEALDGLTRSLRRERGGPVNVLILTDSLNTSGEYGRSFRQAADPDYRQDQERMLRALKGRNRLFDESGGRQVDNLGLLHIEALPGADVALMRGLAAMRPGSTVDDWVERYVTR